MAVTKPPKVKVVIHPDGKIELHHAAPTSHFQTYKGDVPGAVQSRVQNKQTGVTSDRYSIPGGKQQIAFAAGKGFYARPTAAAPVSVRTPVVAPPAPIPQTIQQQAQSILDPVSKSITDAINARVQAQQSAITGYSKDLAGLMGQYAPASKAIYGDAQQGQAAVDAATGGVLQGQGQAGQDALGAELAKISADPGTAARLNATAAANTTGATGALAARGSASLSDLISRGASAQDYGAKQPGIAGLYGLQATKAAQSQGTNDTASAVGQIEQKLPDVIQQLKGNQQAAATNRQQQAANETSRAVAATQLLGKAPPWAAKILGIKPGSSTQQAVSAAQASTDRQAAAAAKVTAASTSANAKVTAAGTSAAAKVTAAKVLADARTAAAAKKASSVAVKPLSPTTLRKAGTDAEDLYHGVQKTDSKGNTVTTAYSVTYPEAIKTLMGRYPELGRPGVLALVNRWYPPGANFPGTTIPNGRPYPKVTGVARGGRIGQPPETPGQIVREVPKVGQ